LCSVRRNFWPAGMAARFPGPMPGENFAVPTDDRVGLNHLETSSPTGPASVQHNHKSRSQRWRRKRRGPFFWKTASWWRSARISACRAARVRKVEASKAKKATKRELIVVATMISRMGGHPLFSDRTEFSVFPANDHVRRALLLLHHQPRSSTHPARQRHEASD